MKFIKTETFEGILYNHNNKYDCLYIDSLDLTNKHNERTLYFREHFKTRKTKFKTLIIFRYGYDN